MLRRPRTFLVDQGIRDVLQNAEKRILLLPTGLSNISGFVDFNENFATGCGSILKSKKDAHWCSQTVNTMKVPVARLDSLLSVVPSYYSFHYLKVDVEGADHLVLYGGGKYIPQFNFVSIECRPLGSEWGSKSRDGSCDQATITKYMRDIGFTHSECTVQVDDCHFAKSNYGLLEAKIMHKAQYHSFNGHSDLPYYVDHPSEPHRVNIRRNCPIFYNRTKNQATYIRIDAIDEHREALIGDDRIIRSRVNTSWGDRRHALDWLVKTVYTDKVASKVDVGSSNSDNVGSSNSDNQRVAYTMTNLTTVELGAVEIYDVCFVLILFNILIFKKFFLSLVFHYVHVPSSIDHHF